MAKHLCQEYKYRAKPTNFHFAAGMAYLSYPGLFLINSEVELKTNIKNIMKQELPNKDRFDLNRFIRAQEDCYSDALSELKSGRKRSHWMWYIFPQFKGLGYSTTSVQYSIKSIDETHAYLQHPILGLRLKECSEAVLAIEGKSASEIFGYPDDLKLKSSMTLFGQVADNDSCFFRILDKYFEGRGDTRTLELLKNS